MNPYDVTLVVKDEKEFKAHRHVFSVASHFFEKLEVIKKISESMTWLSRLPTRWLTRVAGRRVSPLPQTWVPTHWLDKIEICLDASTGQRYYELASVICCS